MPTLTIRNLDEKVKRALQVRAAINGRSMEAEARDLITGLVRNNSTTAKDGPGTAIHKPFSDLGDAGTETPLGPFSKYVADEETGNLLEDIALKEGLGTAIQRLFAPLGGVELQIPARRKSHRQIPTFEP